VKLRPPAGSEMTQDTETSFDLRIATGISHVPIIAANGLTHLCDYSLQQFLSFSLEDRRLFCDAAHPSRNPIGELSVLPGREQSAGLICYC
jgi:hypothetical protein